MKKRKSAVTMIEIMIVIFLIGIIGGVLAYNFKGSLDKGKEFKSKEGADRIHNILMLAVAEGTDIEEVKKDWEAFVRKSPLAGRPEDLIKDGWGKPYTVTVEGDDIKVNNSKTVVVSS
ncbi:MAG: type II secretion system protein [Chlamydiales bacterium]|nr:type II secretion system protein [Chlamydiales bacterium]